MSGVILDLTRETIYHLPPPLHSIYDCHASYMHHDSIENGDSFRFSICEGDFDLKQNEMSGFNWNELWSYDGKKSTGSI